MRLIGRTSARRDRWLRLSGRADAGVHLALLDAWREAMTSCGDGTGDTLYGRLPERTSLYDLESVYAREFHPIPRPAAGRILPCCVISVPGGRG